MAMALARQMAIGCWSVEKAVATTVVHVETASVRSKADEDGNEELSDETTPTTTASDDSESAGEEEESVTQDPVAEEVGTASTPNEGCPAVPQLGPGLFPSSLDVSDEEEQRAHASSSSHDPPTLAPMTTAASSAAADRADGECEAAEATRDESEAPSCAVFAKEETLFVFDWDDTILPSTWVQRQGLRLDDGSVLNAWHRERLAEAAKCAAETLRLAKQHGTVVLLTNAERGWIELSCLKFLPTLLPLIENVKIVSARTTYEGPDCPQPLDWKVRAFEVEIGRACGIETLEDPAKRKNIHSLGDSVHEREALMRATARLPNCRTKSLKFEERPDVSQICKQHELIVNCFDEIVHHDADLDLSINCS